MTPRRIERAVDIFTLIVVASVGVALAGLTWRLTGVRSAQTPPAPAGPPPAPAAVDVGPALALAPFGRASADSAQPTGLALQLRGVILAYPRSASTALIAAPGAAPVGFITGQSVPGGATIEQIEVDRVLLRVNGRLERLDMQRVSVASAAPAPATTVPVPPPASVPPTGPSDGSGAPSMQPIAPPPAPSAATGASLLESLGGTASPEGYRVGPDPAPNARRAGVEPGDLIERINGYPASAVAANRQLMAAAMATGSVQVDVRRNGRKISLSFPLR